MALPAIIRSAPRSREVSGSRPSAALRTAEPLNQIFAMEGRVRLAVAIGFFVALLFHGIVAARAAMIPLELIRWSEAMKALVHDKLWATYEVDLVKEPPPPPAEPEPPPPEPEKVEEKAPPPPPVDKEPPKESEPPPPPAPAAAQAGAVLTAPDDIPDFTGGDFTQGNAATYAGGVTHAQGTGTTAVRSVRAVATGVPNGTGTAPPAPPGPSKAHGAGLRGSSDWKCPWPNEAEAEQIDDAYVTVQVTVGVDGRPKQVSVVNDPGHGFGREARQCAMRETYNVAVDAVGSPIEGQTKPIRIHFER